MKRLVLAVVVCLLAATASLATPLCGGSQNVLATGFACEMGGLLFSNFSVINAGNVPISTMNLVTADVLNGYVNLNLNPNLGSPTTNADVWFYFTVTGDVNGVDLAVGGNKAGVTERVCSTPINVNAGNICTGGIGNQLAIMNTFSGNQVFASFPGNNFVSPTYYFKDIQVQTGGELSSVSESFHVPEPVTMVLLGSGLLGLGLLRRRVK